MHYAWPVTHELLHMPLSAADMEPDASLSLPIGNYSSLRGVGGTRVWQEVCVCVSKGDGGLAQMSRASTAHLKHQSSTDWPLTFDL